MVRPRKDEQIDIRAHAIAATIALLDAQESASLTLAQVAAAVGCRAPALYAYFASKDALLRAVHDEGFRLLLQGKLALVARQARSPLERLHAGGLAYLRFAFEHPGLYRLMFAPPPVHGLPADAFAQDPGAQCLGLLRAAVLACQADGYLPQQDATQMAYTVWAAVHGAASLVLQGRAPVQAGQDPSAAVTGVVDVLMAFIERSRPALPH